MAQGKEATFFTMVGSRDPQEKPQGAQGPALDLLAALLTQGESITEVLVAWTPESKSDYWEGGYTAKKDALVAQIRAMLPAVRIRELAITVRPNAAAELLPVLAAALERYRFAGRLHVNTSSGTPQMLEALKALRGTGWFGTGDVTLWQIDDPKYRQPGQAFVRVATTPFLEEAFKLSAAFAALRRFDFAGARDGFEDLPDSEVKGRHERIGVLAQVAEALYWLDARDFTEADDILRNLDLPVPAVAPLEKALRSAEAGRDGVLWLTWARFDRAVQQERVSDALIWAVILREAMVVNLLARRGIADDAKELRRSANRQLWDEVMQASPELRADVGTKAVLNIKDITKKLMLLRTGVFTGGLTEFVDALNDHQHPDMKQTTSRRNKVIHQGAVPQPEWLEQATAAVSRMMGEYPFQDTLHRQWQKDPSAAPFSAQSLLALVDELEEWMG